MADTCRIYVNKSDCIEEMDARCAHVLVLLGLGSYPQSTLDVTSYQGHSTHHEISDETAPAPLSESGERPKHRGRPKGSRNKSTYPIPELIG